MSGIFGKIRASCADVAECARWVRIDHARLMQYPESLSLNIGPLTHTEEHHLVGKGDDTLAFFVILDAINFGSGYFPYLEKDKGLSGYFTVAKRLKEFCEKEGVPSPNDLRDSSADLCAKIFQQASANKHMQELMELFALAWKQLGDWIISDHGGDYLGFLRNSNTAEEAISALLKMPFFRDVSIYGRREVSFLKRAQILLHDLKIADPNHKLLAFGDLKELTIFADNVIPFVLKADRVLIYDKWLEQRIEEEELIGSGSYEEIELRACSLHAVELLREIICDEIRDISARELDYCLWARGQELKKFTSDKRHRTRTVYY